MSVLKSVIGVVGMPGSGKSLVDEVAVAMGLGVVSMGDVVREEAKNRGFQLTHENLTRIMFELREKNGLGVIAVRCVPSIVQSLKQGVVVDGLRSMYEVEEFRKRFPKFNVLCVHASPETRFHRLFGRGRSDDPVHSAAFLDRDAKELQIGIGSVIALSDFILCNEGTTRQFKTKVRRFFRIYGS
jgi:dephospho-CoA kinase